MHFNNLIRLNTKNEYLNIQILQQQHISLNKW